MGGWAVEFPVEFPVGIGYAQGEMPLDLKLRGECWASDIDLRGIDIYWGVSRAVGMNAISREEPTGDREETARWEKPGQECVVT